MACLALGATVLCLLASPLISSATDHTDEETRKEVHVIASHLGSGPFKTWLVFENIVKMALQDIEDYGLLKGFKIVLHHFDSKVSSLLNIFQIG